LYNFLPSLSPYIFFSFVNSSSLPLLTVSIVQPTLATWRSFGSSVESESSKEGRKEGRGEGKKEGRKMNEGR
jgi:hypothetical protein